MFSVLSCHFLFLLEKLSLMHIFEMKDRAFGWDRASQFGTQVMPIYEFRAEGSSLRYN
ncbi:hypothetical protein HanRHA438_Chr15g0707301 [Helianthus annuus]|nr:hypothetical protein HanRHA438_Chr15g0707301 [Helianthus annuus]